jgi:uncharacterized delta-60 repeat protein
MLVAALALLTSVVRAVPALDPGFGSGGEVRIGVPAGFEDVVYASTVQSDGKVVVAGASTGRRSTMFVTRFTTNGQLDPSFGDGGTRLIGTCLGFYKPLQIEPGADGGLWLLASVNGSAFEVIPISASGELFDLFSCHGTIYGATDDAVLRGGIHMFVQPDGKLMIVTDVRGGGGGWLKLRRFTPQGALDLTLGPNGEREINGLPSDFAFTSTQLAVAEPGGGFTLVANGQFTGSTYLILRFDANGNPDLSLDGVGYRSGIEVGNARDVPLQLGRTPDGGYVLFGYAVDEHGFRNGKHLAWRVDSRGVLVPSFGNAGRLELPDTQQDPQHAVLPDGSLAVAMRSFDSRTLVAARYDAAGRPLAAFGSGGVASMPLAGYLGFNPAAIHAAADGGIVVAGWGYARMLPSGTSVVFRGSDALVAAFAANGAPRGGFGRGDGVAVWNTPALSNDRLQAIRFDAQRRIVLAGYTDGEGVPDYLLMRLSPDGAPDPAYGANGRLYPRQVTRFVGPVRAAMQPDEAMIIVGGEALGTFGSVRSVTAFRATQRGALDSSFHPDLLPAGPNAAPALGLRPDGRIVYGTVDIGSNAVLQQLLPDGAQDISFGAAGKVTFPIGDNSSVQADLAILPDGSVVFAVFTNSGIRIIKVDAHGALDPGFGVNGQLVQTVANLQPNYLAAPVLLALADGTFVAAQRTLDNRPEGGLPRSGLYMMRVSADGRVQDARSRFEIDGYATYALAALPDSSVVIARSSDEGLLQRAFLFRLLAEGSLDGAFGVGFGGGLGITLGLTAVDAIAIDPEGRLLVSGQDRTSAVLRRYLIDAGLASVPVVEYFNANLGHYFVTAGPAEMASIDAGGAGPGWQRTGMGFRAWVPELGVSATAHPVCRFYGTPGLGPNSHFYTAEAGECAAVKNDPGWTYEGTAFFIDVPAGSGCAAGSAPVYRAYNNRFAQNDSNHRYTQDPAIYAAMLAHGWSGEGIVMCAPQ